MQKALIVSTVNYNPGDEFIRLGQEYLLRRLFPDIQYYVVHKHDPRWVFADFDRSGSNSLWHPRLVSLQYQIYAQTRGRTQQDMLDKSDIVVFAGTPFVWVSNSRFFPSHSGNAEWVGPIWRRLFRRNPDKPVLNLAAGTSVQSPDALQRVANHPAASRFLRKAFERAALTTARDKNTQQAAALLGFDIPVYPCTSLWAAQGAGLEAKDDGYVAVNLMRHAVHKYRATITTTSEWESMAKRMVQRLRSDYRILLVCHSADENLLAKEWFPEIDRVYSQKPEDLLSAYSGAQFGISNRVHGAAGVATFGKPALVIGGDSRVDLIREFRLPALEIRNLTNEKLDAAIDDLIEQRDRYTGALAELKASVEPTYLEEIRNRLAEHAHKKSGGQGR